MQKVLIAPMTLATQEGPYQKILREAGFAASEIDDLLVRKVAIDASQM